MISQLRYYDCSVNDLLTIQQAAEKLGVSSHTLRYYEREGLLGSQISRNESGHRRYSQQSLLWVKLLLCLKQTGMSLVEIRAFAEMSRQGTVTTEERLFMLQRHEKTLSQHIGELQKAHSALQDKIERYEILLADESVAAALATKMQG